MNDQLAESPRKKTGPVVPKPGTLSGWDMCSESFRTLADAGGHLVVSRPDPEKPEDGPKKPIWVGWQERPAAPEVAIAHLARSRDHGVGIIPGSLDTIAADVDAGDVQDLWADIGTPIVWTETRRGTHSYYDAGPLEVTRRDFRLGQCSGQLIGVRQYTLFHSPDAVRRLADGLPRRGTAPIQLELFDLGAVEDPAKRRARHTAPHTSARPVLCPGPLEAATAAKRIRHRTLFWWLRHWAYGEARGASLTTWARRVHLECLAMLAVMPAPRLPLSEVEAMAWDVASWVWSRPPLDRSWRAQFFRGVKREYGRVSHGTVAALWERNRTIVEAVQGRYGPGGPWRGT